MIDSLRWAPRLKGVASFDARAWTTIERLHI